MFVCTASWTPGDSQESPNLQQQQLLYYYILLCECIQISIIIVELQREFRGKYKQGSYAVIKSHKSDN